MPFGKKTLEIYGNCKCSLESRIQTQARISTGVTHILRQSKQQPQACPWKSSSKDPSVTAAVYIIKGDKFDKNLFLLTFLSVVCMCMHNCESLLSQKWVTIDLKQGFCKSLYLVCSGSTYYKDSKAELKINLLKSYGSYTFISKQFMYFLHNVMLIICIWITH